MEEVSRDGQVGAAVSTSTNKVREMPSWILPALHEEAVYYMFETTSQEEKPDVVDGKLNTEEVKSNSSEKESCSEKHNLELKLSISCNGDVDTSESPKMTSSETCTAKQKKVNWNKLEDNYGKKVELKKTKKKVISQYLT